MDPRLLRLFEQGGGDDEVSAIVRLGPGHSAPAGVRIISRFGDIATVRLRRNAIPAAHDSPFVVSMKRPSPLRREARMPPGLAVIATGDYDTRRSPRQRATGRGVIVGIIDWGFDFAHPDFRHVDGSTRLLALWDQSAPSGPWSPQPFGYGRSFITELIDAALNGPDPYGALGYDPSDSDLDGAGAHGTHVSGIAAGNGRGGGPLGVAPDADIVFVHLTTLDPDNSDLADSAAVLEAIDFVRAVAGSRPFVINLSMGQCGDPHDGTTLLEQGLDAMLAEAPGRAVIQSTGNYFSSKQHCSGRLSPKERRVIPWTVPARSDGRMMEMWYSGRDAITVTARAPGGAIVGRAAGGARAVLRVGDRACGELHNRLRDPNNLDNHVVLWVDPDAPAGEWRLELDGVAIADGAYHIWLQREDYSGAQGTFARADSNPFFTTNSICNGHLTVAVGCYDARQRDRPIASFSSAGPTRDGRPKPDLIAPGVEVLSARSTPAGARAGRGRLVRMTGTSMAAPHVTGAVALNSSARAGRAILHRRQFGVRLRQADT